MYCSSAALLVVHVCAVCCSVNTNPNMLVCCSMSIFMRVYTALQDTHAFKPDWLQQGMRLCTFSTCPDVPVHTVLWAAQECVRAVVCLPLCCTHWFFSPFPVTAGTVLCSQHLLLSTADRGTLLLTECCQGLCTSWPCLGIALTHTVYVVWYVLEPDRLLHCCLR
jgi:hypothetical protein